MILNRLGNKKRIAEKIYTRFPEHDLYIEPFFGAGGMFFQKPLAKYSIVNDLDQDVYNLYWVIRNREKELVAAWEKTPIHGDLFQYWRKQLEQDPVHKAIRFLVLSNFSYMGKGETLRLGFGGNKPDLAPTLEKIQTYFVNTKFMNVDFRHMLRKIAVRQEREKARCFLYLDPPYLDTDNNYSSGFTKQDSADLFRMATSSGIRFAMSEFDHPFILDQARQYGLHVIEIGERVNLKNRRTEYLICNY